jgi:hypothetical protein
MNDATKLVRALKLGIAKALHEIIFIYAHHQS